MNLTRWEPFRDLLSLQDRMSRVFDDPFARFTTPMEAARGWFPPVDIHEETDMIVLRAEIPGIGRDDIDLSVENGTLTLRGEKKFEKQVDSDNAIRQERFYGSFVRSFVLPSLIDSNRIQASYRDGVLEVVLLKAEEAKPKKIKILSGNGQAEKRVEERALRASS